MVKKKAVGRKASRKTTTAKKAGRAAGRPARAAARSSRRVPARRATAPAPADWTGDPAVAAILLECEQEVLKGLVAERPEPPDQVGLLPDARKEFEDFFGPRIKARHDQSGTGGKVGWDETNPHTGRPEKEKPLLVANHLGRICGILSGGPKVTRRVAIVAAAAVQKDENCRGAAGTGDWCA